MNESPNDLLRTAAILKLTDMAVELGLPFIIEDDTFNVHLPPESIELSNAEDPLLD